ncbi:hypothetical protein WJX79_000504 [Trebouxia sp. C0005]
MVCAEAWLHDKGTVLSIFCLPDICSKRTVAGQTHADDAMPEMKESCQRDHFRLSATCHQIIGCVQDLSRLFLDTWWIASNITGDNNISCFMKM